MAKKETQINETHHHLKTLILGRVIIFFLETLAVVIAILATLTISYELFYQNKIFLGTKIAGVEVSTLNREQALDKVSRISTPVNLNFIVDGKNITLAFNSIAVKYDPKKTIDQAFQTGREKNIAEALDTQFKNIVFGSNLPLVYSLNEDSLTQAIESLATQFSTPAVNPAVNIKNGSIVINPGKKGREVDREGLRSQISNTIGYAKSDLIPLLIISTSTQLAPDEVVLVQKRAEKFLGKSLKIISDDQKFEYIDKDIVTLIDPLQSGQSYDQEKIAALVANIAKNANREPQNARFVFENGKVKEFNPALKGVEVKQVQLSQDLTSALQKLETTDQKELVLELPAVTTEPAVQNAEVNNLGIKELTGRGESTFRGSISSRIHNIIVATNLLNGIMIKPGEEFSFNQNLGDVSIYTGYQQAYVIKDGKTVLGDGGGVCQVSTTFFRAALKSGLPITERHPHSYRVSYYEQGTKPGIDATVYSPYADLKFKNDTPATILVVAKVDTKNLKLTVDFYGTKDGRTVALATPRVWDPESPPPDLYQDDSTLPAGKIKQTEHAVGGIKTSFVYKVERNGEVLQNRTFYSNYRAWQAVYLRGTGPTQ